jgi:hypothetical protein
MADKTVISRKKLYDQIAGIKITGVVLAQKRNNRKSKTHVSDV